MTTPVWSEAMTAFLEVGSMRAIVDRFKNHVDDFLDDFISDAWHIHSTLPLLANRLRNG